VVGAGGRRLTAALTLAGMGRDVLVLEARGRLHTVTLGAGVAADLGGAWLQQYVAKRWPGRPYTPGWRRSRQRSHPLRLIRHGWPGAEVADPWGTERCDRLILTVPTALLRGHQDRGPVITPGLPRSHTRALTRLGSGTSRRSCCAIRSRGGPPHRAAIRTHPAANPGARSDRQRITRRQQYPAPAPLSDNHAVRNCAGRLVSTTERPDLNASREPPATRPARAERLRAHTGYERYLVPAGSSPVGCSGARRGG
jgi:hypothetical protein